MFDVSRRVSRREFAKVAVAIGGMSALSACLDREVLGGSEPDVADQQFEQGPEDLSTLPERQFDWNYFVLHDEHGNTVLPQHQLLLFLEYTGSEPPTDDERQQVEAAFRTLERAFQRGTGGDPTALVNDGLLFMVGYAPRYFDRFEDPLAEEIDLPRPEETLATIDEDPAKADPYDAIVLLNSDAGSILLAAEAALTGSLETVNGVDVEATLEGVFEVADRRSGFVGRGLPAQELDNPDIDENADMSMGFKSGFRDNQPTEDMVAIDDGPFIDGTTLHVSRLRIDLESWYGDNDLDDRVELMFSPDHTVEEVGETGRNLARDSRVTEETVERLDEHACRHNRVGHTQKTARARTDDFQARILRRSESIATDSPGDEVGFNFTSIQHGIDDFVETRAAMNSTDIDDVPPEDHGILHYLTVDHRANFLVPPRSLRALPEPRKN